MNETKPDLAVQAGQGQYPSSAATQGFEMEDPIPLADIKLCVLTDAAFANAKNDYNEGTYGRKTSPMDPRSMEVISIEKNCRLNLCLRDRP